MRMNFEGCECPPPPSLEFPMTIHHEVDVDIFWFVSNSFPRRWEGGLLGIFGGVCVRFCFQNPDPISKENTSFSRSEASKIHTWSLESTSPPPPLPPIRLSDQDCQNLYLSRTKTIPFGAAYIGWYPSKNSLYKGSINRHNGDKLYDSCKW